MNKIKDPKKTIRRHHNHLEDINYQKEETTYDIYDLFNVPIPF